MDKSDKAPMFVVDDDDSDAPLSDASSNQWKMGKQITEALTTMQCQVIRADMAKKCEKAFRKSFCPQGCRNHYYTCKYCQQYKQFKKDYMLKHYGMMVDDADDDDAGTGGSSGSNVHAGDNQPLGVTIGFGSNMCLFHWCVMCFLSNEFPCLYQPGRKSRRKRSWHDWQCMGWHVLHRPEQQLGP